jgi:hypothetical protein
MIDPQRQTQHPPARNLALLSLPQEVKYKAMSRPLVDADAAVLGDNERVKAGKKTVVETCGGSTRRVRTAGRRCKDRSTATTTLWKR